MSTNYQPGDEVNGHRLNNEGTRWEPITVSRVKGQAPPRYSNGSILGFLAIVVVVLFVIGSFVGSGEQTNESSFYDDQWRGLSSEQRAIACNLVNDPAAGAENVARQMLTDDNWFDVTDLAEYLEDRC